MATNKEIHDTLKVLVKDVGDIKICLAGYPDSENGGLIQQVKSNSQRIGSLEVKGWIFIGVLAASGSGIGAALVRLLAR